MNKIVPLIAPILKQYNIPQASLFGSYARGDFNEQSDIDILFDPPQKMSLLDLAGLKIELEDALGKKVDLVSSRAIDKNLEPYIHKDLVKII